MYKKSPPRVPEYFAKSLTTRQKWQIQRLVKVILRKFLKDYELFRQIRFDSSFFNFPCDVEYRIVQNYKSIWSDNNLDVNVIFSFPTCNFPGIFRFIVTHITGYFVSIFISTIIEPYNSRIEKSITSSIKSIIYN